jgi:hypothetical protein
MRKPILKKRAELKGVSLVIELGHICPKAKDPVLNWQTFEMVEDDGDMTAFECPLCKVHVCVCLEHK